MGQKDVMGCKWPLLVQKWIAILVFFALIWLVMISNGFRLIKPFSIYSSILDDSLITFRDQPRFTIRDLQSNKYCFTASVARWLLSEHSELCLPWTVCAVVDLKSNISCRVILLCSGDMLRNVHFLLRVQRVHSVLLGCHLCLFYRPPWKTSSPVLLPVSHTHFLSASSLCWAVKKHHWLYMRHARHKVQNTVATIATYEL